MDLLHAAAITWTVFAVIALAFTAYLQATGDGSSGELGIVMFTTWILAAPLIPIGFTAVWAAHRLENHRRAHLVFEWVSALLLVGPVLVLGFAAMPLAWTIRTLRRHRHDDTPR